MTYRSMLYLVLLLIGPSLAIAACSGGNQLVRFTDLPVYPQAAEIQPGEDPFADLVIDLMTGGSESESASTEVTIASLPEGTSWNQVFAFYTNELQGTDWQDDTSLSQSSESMSMAGWTRGSGANEQALLVGHAIDPQSDRPLAIVVLISER